jgi:hypothetical protein
MGIHLIDVYLIDVYIPDPPPYKQWCGGRFVGDLSCEIRVFCAKRSKVPMGSPQPPDSAAISRRCSDTPPAIIFAYVRTNPSSFNAFPSEKPGDHQLGLFKRLLWPVSDDAAMPNWTSRSTPLLQPCAYAEDINICLCICGKSIPLFPLSWIS